MENKEFLIRVQQILIEANFSRSNEEVLDSIDLNDSFFKNQLSRIKSLRIQEKVKLKKNIQERVLEKFNSLLASFGSIDDLISNFSKDENYKNLVPMFRKLEGIDEKDLSELLIESKLMDIIDQIDLDED